MTPRYITMKSPKGVNGEMNGMPGSMPGDLRARQAIEAELREEIANAVEHEEEALQQHDELRE